MLDPVTSNETMAHHHLIENFNVFYHSSVIVLIGADINLIFLMSISFPKFVSSANTTRDS